MIETGLRTIGIRTVTCLLVGLIICAVSYESRAQDANDAVTHLNRLDEHFKEPVAPRAEFNPTIPDSADAITADRIKFALSGINVDGSTVYSGRDLLPLYESFLGSEVSLTDVFQIARRITVKYRGDGYILSRAVVPAQQIQAGVVTIDVVEGFVSGF
jgi:hemolysin activation/secretion protein